MHIKICGCRSWADATVAARAGATHVGFVFAPSPRRIPVSEAAAIAPEVRGEVALVGVFVDAPLTEARVVARRVGLTAVQLHGSEPPESCRILREEGVEVWKALRPRSPEELAEEAGRYRGIVDALLVEGFSEEAAGGTGTPLPHEWLEDWRERLFGEGSPGSGTAGAGERSGDIRPEPGPVDPPALILAGGLGPDNVAEAIRRVRPDGVDVSSGVESEPGEKDHDRVRRFVERAREAVRGPGPVRSPGGSPPP